VRIADASLGIASRHATPPRAGIPSAPMARTSRDHQPSMSGAALEYQRGGGVPCLLAIHKDVRNATISGSPTVRRSAAARRHHRDELQGGMRDRSVRRAGGAVRGLVELIKAGYETLVDAGYAPEMPISSACTR